MRLVEIVGNAVQGRLAEGPLREPSLALIGAADAVAETLAQAPDRVGHGVRDRMEQVAGAPAVGWSLVADLPVRVSGAYDALVARGHVKAVEIGAENAVRARVDRVGDRVAPGAAKAAARVAVGRRRLAASPRAQRAKAAAQRAAERIAESPAPPEVKTSYRPAPGGR